MITEVRLRANVAGEVRLTTRRRLAAGCRPSAERAPLLVYNRLLQDSISSGHFAIKPGYGWAPDGRSFTADARRLLREFGSVVDAGDRERTIFLTGTLPGSSPESLQALAEWSAWVVSRLSQWLRDRWTNALFFGVWEWQKRGALHLHVVVQLPDVLAARRLKASWKLRWAKLIDGVSRRSGHDLWRRKNGDTWETARWMLRTDAQTVEKSCTRYLSKYLGKCQARAKQQAHLPPSSWWFACQRLRKAASSLRIDKRVELVLPTQASLKFERLAATIVEGTSIAFPLTNEFDSSYRGVIGLVVPAMAGVIVRLLSDEFSAHERAPDCHVHPWAASVGQWCAELGGILIKAS